MRVSYTTLFGFDGMSQLFFFPFGPPSVTRASCESENEVLSLGFMIVNIKIGFSNPGQQLHMPLFSPRGIGINALYTHHQGSRAPVLASGAKVSRCMYVQRVEESLRTHQTKKEISEHT